MKIKVYLADKTEKVYEGMFARTDSNNNLEIWKDGVQIIAIVKASEWKSWELIS